MIILSDQDQTAVPKSIEDCVQLASIEYKNRFYDVSDRTNFDAAQHRYDGKLAEAQLCMSLKNIGFYIIHGVRFGKQFADSGADLTIQNKYGKYVQIQIKTCGLYLNFYNRQFTTAEQNVEKLCRFNGPIVVKSKVNGTTIWYCTNGMEIYNNIRKSKTNGYYVPVDAFSDTIKKTITYDTLNIMFEWHSKPYVNKEFTIG